ncbi:MAG: tRNA lysidine(34) synthetase TilS [Lachnospiraceae bacterium]|nr:tRNA lysidine(34) synthetase TilS [Lachnospiraceae bacterium]
MQKKIISFMEENHMVEEGECILAAVSGGADSLCLLLILLNLQERKGCRVCAVHVEHGIRGADSLQDAQFVEEFCKRQQVPCKIFHCQAPEYAKAHKMTLEEAARKLRYDFFDQAAEIFGADKIAVAHNQNDCAETMLFHLIRGTGLKGMCGILPVRGRIIRPLLCVERKEIEEYLEQKGQDFCLDKTNEGLDYSRNKIRRQVLPVLTEINDQTVAHMNQTSVMMMELTKLMEDLTREAEKKYVRQGKCGIYISSKVLKENIVIQKFLFHRILAETAGSSQDISRVHVKQIQELFQKQTGRKLYFPYGVTGERVYDEILLKKKEPDFSSMKEQNLKEEVLILPVEGILQIPGYGYEIRTRLLEKPFQKEEIPKKMYTKWVDYDKIKGIMQLRTSRENDFFVISADGRRKKLKKYFTDEKIPREERKEMLFLVDDVHIIWAIGRRISEDVKITEDTRRILEIQVCGGAVHE